MQEFEDGLLNRALWSRDVAEEAFTKVTVDDFTPGNAMQLAELITAAVDQDQPDVYVFCQVESAKLGRPEPAYVHKVYGHIFTADWTYYADKILEASRSRQVETALTQALSDTKKGHTSPEAVLEALSDRLGILSTPVDRNDDTLVLSDILDTPEAEDNWAFPRLLMENERLMITGNEGGGKSMFVYQMLTGAAFGYDTLHLEPTEPKRVMFIDVENNEVQTKRNVVDIVPLLREARPDVEPEWRWFRQRVINLLDPAERNNLIARVRHYAPDILYMGTVYKLTDTDDNVHRTARAIQVFGDKVRDHVGCAMVVEHHAGHGFNNDRNNMRPEGSSYFMRWPDAGYGLSRVKTNTDQRIVKLSPWRGDRFTGRDWPVALRSGGVYPWTPISAGEWEAVYADKYGDA